MLDSCISLSADAQPVLPLLPARQSPVAFIVVPLTQNSSYLSLPLQLLAWFWMEFLQWKKKRQNYHFFITFSSSVGLGSVLGA